MQLAAPDVDGMDAAGAGLQHAIGESAGAGAEIEANQPLGAERESIERRLQFLAATADKTGKQIGDFDLAIRIDRGAGLVDKASVNRHLAGADQALGLLTALGQITLGEQRVDSCAFGQNKTQWLAGPALGAGPESVSAFPGN